MTQTRAFRLQLWPTLFAVPALIILLGLAFWQLERREWKLDLILQMQSRLAMEPIDAALLASLPPEELAYRYVNLTGQYEEPELHLGPRYYLSKMGYHLMQPFVVDGVGTILVDRGWVAQDHKEASTRPETLPAKGEVTITGILRENQTRRGIGISNKPEKNFWFWTDPEEISAYLERDLLPVWMQLTQVDHANDEGTPYPNANLELPHNDHLEYAITWFAIALGLVVIYVLYHREQMKEDRN